ncbi:hypothetical protein CEB3_c10510 [Peptococcaceae bacterium CEB3]|nr:hypothetical protein CEB3_c10510 [Peptococcaceae bacterium CEB3]
MPTPTSALSMVGIWGPHLQYPDAMVDAFIHGEPSRAPIYPTRHVRYILRLWRVSQLRDDGGIGNVVAQRKGGLWQFCISRDMTWLGGRAALKRMPEKERSRSQLFVCEMCYDKLMTVFLIVPSVILSFLTKPVLNG